MLAIFIEPKLNLKKFIIKWKLKSKKYSNSNFVNHPPHSTIFIANIKNQKKVEKEILKITKNLKSFEIVVDKTDMFPNDSLTNKDTIFLNIKKNKKLFDLQKKIANKLKSYVEIDKNLEFRNQNFNNSYLKYGFPFVGLHWKPHFTIGSIKNFKKKKEFRLFIEKKINFINNVSSLSLWRVNKNKHNKLKEFKFKND